MSGLKRPLGLLLLTICALHSGEFVTLEVTLHV